MILIGIDVAKDKHDCFIQTAEGNVLHKPFTIANVPKVNIILLLFVAKKLVRVIFHLQRTGESFLDFA